MKGRYFCEVCEENDNIIKFQMVEADYLDEAISILKNQYKNIKQWTIKDMITEVQYTSTND
jgi:hypothetical protein